eukprot:TRINITY_DN5917_c0_g1_i2.p1 TRINITY_DN5917_c0_g1~~TRINITY_DN5917_c0_g1_i2.p1  ORF type:complete len:332 (+),score=67.11 TRINITY_DN5917_c0_g1_i2:224-1219(+)
MILDRKVKEKKEKDEKKLQRKNSYDLILKSLKEDQLSTVQLSKELNKKQITEVLKYTVNKKNVNEIFIEQSQFTQGNALAMSKTIKSCNALSRIRIYNVDFWSHKKADMVNTMVSEGMLQSDVLDTLDFTGSKIFVSGVEAIARLVELSPSLKHLCLQHTKMTDTGVHYIVDAIKSNQKTQITTIDLSGNRTSNNAVRYLLNGLISIESIQSIHINKHIITKSNWSEKILQVEKQAEDERDKMKTIREDYNQMIQKQQDIIPSFSSLSKNENYVPVKGAAHLTERRDALPSHVPGIKRRQSRKDDSFGQFIEDDQKVELGLFCLVIRLNLH